MCLVMQSNVTMTFMDIEKKYRHITDNKEYVKPPPQLSMLIKVISHYM